MTAVQGMEMLPPRESALDSSAHVEKKGEPSPFDELLAKEDASREEAASTAKDSSARKTDRPDRKLKAARVDEPVRPANFSLKKIADLLDTAGEEVLADSQTSPKLSIVRDKIAAGDTETEGLTEQVRKLTVAASGPASPADETDVKTLISRFLKGELSPEELDELAALDKEGMEGKPVPGLTDGKGKTAGDGSDDSDADGKLLKGILTEDGELVYFEEIPDEKSLLSSEKGKSPSRGLGAGKANKVQIEINVTDLRTGTADPHAAAMAALQEKVSHAKEGSAGTGESDLSDDLLTGPAEKMFSPEGAGGRFEAPVSREVSHLFRDYMNETGNKELVRKIDFILKNDNQGEIKLILKPEALGNVRINLSLNENHIAGKIIVDNSSVRDLFMNNMDQLTSMLKQNGYENASLEVWVGQDGRNGGKQNQGGDREEEKRLRSANGLKRLEESVPQTAYAEESDRAQVNMVI